MWQCYVGGHGVPQGGAPAKILLLAFCALFGRCGGRCVSPFQAFVHSGWRLSLVVVGVCLLMFWGFCSSWGAFCFAVFVVLPLVLCFFSSWCCGPLMLVTAIGVCLSMPRGCWAVFHSFGGFLLVLWGFCFLFSNCPLQLLLMVCVVYCASGLLLLFFSSFFLFFLFLAVCVLCGLLPASLAWCLAFPCPCAWFCRPLLTSFCCCSWFVLNCVGLVVVVAVLAVAEAVAEAAAAAGVVVVVVVVGVCSPLVLVWLVGGGVCSPLVWGQHLFVGVVDGWCLFAFGFGVVGWWWCLLAFGVRPAFVRWRGGWLVFVRLWFWCGWLVVAFARLWWPRVCSLGRWLASVCLGSVVAAGFVVACHGYAAWDAVPGPLRFGELFGTYTLLVLFCGSVDVFLWRNSRVSRSSLKCMHGYSGSCWCWRPSSF